MFKKGLALILAVILCFALTACLGKNEPSKDNSSETLNNETSSLPKDDTNSTASTPDDTSSSTPSETESTKPNSDSKLNIVMPDKNSKDYYVKLDIPDGTLKVLVLGDSLMDDSVRYLSRIAESRNFDVILGKGIYTSSDISTQLSEAKADNAIYEYSKNFSNVGSRSLNSLLADDQWDVVLLTQSTALSGVEDSYADLAELCEYINGKVPANCKIAWCMNWAYAENYDSAEYSANYGSSQQKMYNSIVKQTAEKVEAVKDIDLIIPIGTVIQNIRSGFIGEKILRNGEALYYGRGQYAAALTLYRCLIEKDGKKVEYSAPCTSKELDLIKKAIDKALEEPYSVADLK